MKKTTRVLLGAVLLLLCLTVTKTLSAGFTNTDPSMWTYEVKKKGDNVYDLVFTVKLEAGWHIWALDPGGDGSLRRPIFAFDKNPDMVVQGDLTEKGKKETLALQGMANKVFYYSDRVEYVQTIQVNGFATVTGKHHYQLCSNLAILSPRIKDFSFDVGEKKIVEEPIKEELIVEEQATEETVSEEVAEAPVEKIQVTEENVSEEQSNEEQVSDEPVVEEKEVAQND